MKLVIVDDFEDFRLTFRELLAPYEQFQILGESGTVVDAIKKITHFKPDVAVLDFQLPDGTAIDILNHPKIRSIQLTKIIFSNNTGGQYIRAAINAGADYYFNKVWEIEKLVETLTELAVRFPSQHVSINRLHNNER